MSNRLQLLPTPRQLTFQPGYLRLADQMLIVLDGPRPQNLYAMAGQGYAYAIIGGVGPVEFYAKTVGAVVIEGSDPGIYGNMLTA